MEDEIVEIDQMWVSASQFSLFYFIIKEYFDVIRIRNHLVGKGRWTKYQVLMWLHLTTEDTFTKKQFSVRRWQSEIRNDRK